MTKEFCSHSSLSEVNPEKALPSPQLLSQSGFLAKSNKSTHFPFPLNKHRHRVNKAAINDVNDAKLTLTLEKNTLYNKLYTHSLHSVPTLAVCTSQLLDKLKLEVVCKPRPSSPSRSLTRPLTAFNLSLPGSQPRSR